MDKDVISVTLNADKSGGNKRRPTEEEKQEMIRAGLARKKECESVALRVVERLCEPGVDREWLRQSVS